MAELVKPKPKPLLLIGGVVASLFLIGLIALMIESRAEILREGREVVLKTQPIDPRDLLRGRYVRLNYEIQNIEGAVLERFAERFGEDEQQFLRDETIYVTLEPGENGFHEVVDIFREPPEDALFIRGTTNINPSRIVRIRPDYGINRFYTNETLAPELEARMREGEITTVILAVDDRGTAQIKAFQQDGVNIITEQLY
ncbi:MAG: GDYXXLXY domain-containing protein [Pseudomonadota bacterium]